MTKPTIGRIVHFYDPKVTQRIGWTEGFGGRGIGPYAAMVINDRGPNPELVVFFPGVGGHLVKDVAERPAEITDKPYWTWPETKETAAIPTLVPIAEAKEPAADWDAGGNADPFAHLSGLEKARAVAAANRAARKAAAE